MDNNEENGWYGCPKCKIIWRIDPDDDEITQIFNPPKDADKILPAVEGEEFEVKKYYPQKLCPYCGEIIINGKKKGPIKKIDLEREGIKNVQDLKCPVCDSEDAEYRSSDLFREDSGTFICNKCSSHTYIEFNSDDELTFAAYREDLEYVEYINQFKEAFELLSKIMNTQGTPIKKEDLENKK